MAQTPLTITQMKDPFVIPAADGVDFALVAADAANGNSFQCTGKELLIVQNSGVSARTLTVTSVPGRDGRTGDITNYSIGAGEFAYFTQGLTNSKGWQQSNGMIYIAASNAEVKLAVLRLP